MNEQPQSAAASDSEKLAHIQDLLGRMQELAQQTASGTYTPEQCAELQKELAGLQIEIKRIIG